VILGAARIKEHRAADPLLSLNGSNVSNWPCGANNGSLVQGTASVQPPYSATSFNGGPGVSGTLTRWIRGTLTTTIPAGSRLTAWIVFKFGSDSGKTVFSVTDPLHGSIEMHNVGGVNLVASLPCSDGSDSIAGPTKDTNRHLAQLTMRTTTTNRFKVDDVAYNGAFTGTTLFDETAVSFFGDNGARIGNSTIAHFVLMLGVSTAAQDTAMRTFFRFHPDCLYYGLTYTP
jgi:hypothetical protein